MWKPCTYLIPGGQVLILMAGIPFFPVQEEEINHLFLILPAAGERCQGWICGDMGYLIMALQGFYSGYGHLP